MADPTTPDAIAIDPTVLAANPPAFLRVSTASDGTEANNRSQDPALSRNARFVAFDSRATDLAPGGAAGTEQVFVKDTWTGATTLVSAGLDSRQSALYPSISASGRYVAFEAQPSAGQPDVRADIYVKDLRTGALTLASAAADGTPGDSASFGVPSLSASGRYVAFASDSTNLAPGGVAGTKEVFVKDLRTGAVQVASSTPDGAQAAGGSFEPSMAANGRVVAFVSNAPDFAPGGKDGVVVKDLRTGAVTLASSAADGTPGDGNSYTPSVSANGRLVAFASQSTNLGPGNPYGNLDIFVKDTETGAVTLASAAADDTPGDSTSVAPAISPNGRYVAFESESTNLVPGATGYSGFYVKDLWTGGISEVAANPAPANPRLGPDFTISAVSDTGAVAFSSRAPDLVPGDTNNTYDVFLTR